MPSTARNLRFPFGAIAICLLACACSKQQPRFEHLPASQTGIGFANNLDSTKNYRALYYFYYYNGAGVATGDINNDGLIDIYFAANSRGKNKLYLNKGNMQFEDITAKAQVAGTADWSTGVTMADLNGDGYLDIYVSSVNNLYDFKGHNALYINNKNNTFTESSAQYGLDISTFATQAAFFDYDLDGDLDCYILNQSQKPNENLRDTSFRREFNALAGDRLLRNDVAQSGKFSDVTKTAGIYQSNLGYGLGISIADLNHDGFDDVYVGNDFHENDYCYLNNGNGTFSEKGAGMFNHYSRFSMGNDIGDFDNDGHPDIFTADMLPADEKHLKTYSSGEGFDVYKLIISQNGYQHQYSRNSLHRNNGYAQSFSDVALLHNIWASDWSWSPLLADFDNDGFKDLFISAGIPKRTVDLDFTLYLNNIKLRPGEDPKPAYNKALKMLPDGAAHNVIYQGHGADGFSDQSSAWNMTETGYFSGAAHADFDNDGDLDLVVNPINSPAFVYQNHAPVKSHLSVKLNGSAPNRFGIGAKLWCFSGNKLQYQQFSPVKGFQSASFHDVHFGLDSVPAPDSLLVVWPDRTFQVIKNFPSANLVLNQQDAKGTFNHKEYFRKTERSSVLLPAETRLAWQHLEDPFNDFTEQFLLPHQLSAPGPKIAVADVNHDNLDDFYLCGTLEKPGSLFIQQANGSFTEQTTNFSPGKQEDSDALFLDANGDQHPDLFILSGGHVYPPGHPLLANRLYLNDGKGHFTQKADARPGQLLNQSCAAAGDVDGDGDADILIGVYCQPKQFGTPQSSILLLNDGNGRFSPAPGNLIDLKNAGFVTDVAIADVDGDQRNDLLVAGEWMPLTLYMNRGGSFEKRTLEGSGLWQCLYLHDVNRDGKPDLLVGNWGNNSKLKATAAQPLKLYVRDFDNNGQLDPVVAYTRQGKQFSFLGKDELEKVMPFLKKKFNTYAAFAGKSMDEVFDLKGDGVLSFTVDITASSLFLNEGQGKFTRSDLPMTCQLSPLFTFAETGEEGQFLAGGNFFGVRPSEGRYDAAALQSFSLSPAVPAQVISIKGEVRDMAWLKTKGKNLLLVGKNAGQPEFYTLAAPPQ